MNKKYINKKCFIVLMSLFVGKISFGNTITNQDTNLQYGELQPKAVRSTSTENLNEILNSINTAGKNSVIHNELFNTEERVLLLDQIYANSPYSYSLKLARENLRFFEDNLTYLTILPKKYDMSIQFRLAYPNVKQEDKFSLTSLGGTGDRNFKTKSSAAAGIISLEYGLTNDTSLGLALGGNDQDISFTGDSKGSANSGYVGLFGRTRFGNFKLMAGGGYQFSHLKVNRVIANNLQKLESNSNSYNISSYNGFLEARYAIPFGNSFRLEPKVRGSYYGVNQDSIKEDGVIKDNLLMKIDKQKINMFDTKAGIDFIFENSNADGKVSNTISLEGVAITGDRDKNLTGYMMADNGGVGTPFSIRATKTPEFTGRISYNLEIEQSGGMIYNFKTGLELGKDGYTNYNFLVGVGYKFATYTDIIPQKEVIPEPEPIIEVEPIPEPESIPVEEVKRYTLNLNFASDKAVLTKLDREKIEEVAAEINERENNILVNVVGHTDSTGSDSYNLKLSKRRAKAVADYLMTLLEADEKGFKVTIESDGVGESEPIATNATREGRAKNRRVELRIFE